MNDEKQNQKNDLEKLSKKLEQSLDNQSHYETLDLNEQQERRSQEILDLEKEINELEDDLLPQQDLEPEHQLEAGDDVGLPEVEEEKKLPARKTFGFLLSKKNKQTRAKDWATKEEKLKQKIYDHAKQKKIAQKKEQLEKLMREKERHDFSKRNKRLERKRLRQEKRQRARELRKNKLNLGWYLLQIRRPVFYLILVEVIIYFLSVIPILQNFLLNYLLRLVIILDIIIFAWLAKKLKQLANQTNWTIIKAVTLAGFLVGLVNSIFEALWISQMWTIMNIFVSTAVMTLVALIVALITVALVKQESISK